MALNLFVKCNSNITLKGIKLLAKAHNLSKNKTVNIVNTITCRLEHSGIIVDSLVNRTTPQLLPNKNHHIPVMHQEVLEMFQPESNKKYLDLTFGAGGHTKHLLKSAKNITVYALDRDPVAYELAIQQASSVSSGNLYPLLGKFSDLPTLLADSGLGSNTFDGILIDCGCSSMQFDTKERGFSISKDGPLDMRMDLNRVRNQPSAAEILSHIDEDSLSRILKVYGEEKQAKKIARAIIEARYLFKTLNTTSELARIVENCCGFSARKDKLQRQSHVATKTFQALRILVNDELNELDFAMHFAQQALKIGGKVVVITFHSLEDRIVKNHLHGIDSFTPLAKHYAKELQVKDMETAVKRHWKVVNKNVKTPTDNEVLFNSRSRSAKLRAAIKI